MALLHTLPADDGFSMPAEFDEQQAVVMIWPFRPGSWGADNRKAAAAFRNVAVAVSRFADVLMLAPRAYVRQAREALPDTIRVLEMEADDSWARDVAPTFVRDGTGRLRGVSWRFNAWGGETDGLYASWEKDDALAPALCARLGVDCYDASPFVMEGGAVHSDGEGTLLVTEACLLSKGRNPSLTKAEIDLRLRKYLGAKKVLWLPRGIYNDETNEHVDNVCAFLRPGEVVLAWTDNESDPQYPLSQACLRYLQTQTDARGRAITVHKLPIPDRPVCVTQAECDAYVFEKGEDTREPGERLAASYVNFLFVNGGLVLPVFGNGNEASDRRAAELLAKLCPERTVVPVYAHDILLGGGNIHCITQQIPKGVPTV